MKSMVAQKSIAFLSANVKKSVAKRFARRNPGDVNQKAIIFEIDIDTSIPFAPIKDLNVIADETETLFSVSTVFRISEMKEIEKNL